MPRTQSRENTAVVDRPSEREDSMEKVCIDTIRTLSMDAVQKAGSGHPGTPMALAPLAYVLWRDVLQYDPEDPQWPNRDRFILSNGHASMLLYSVLHLAGVKDPRTGGAAVSLDDIRKLRALDSRCPGHPEHGVTAGVETTTGPLGQGCGNSVGMAMAGKWLAARFNQPDLTVFDYRVYTVCGDGDMMEGVTHEAASLAGHLMLGNLCWIYDNNNITIEGHTSLAFSDNVAERFKAYGWNVERVGDANDTSRIAEALGRFRNAGEVPTLIILDSHIGYGAPHKQDTNAAHGEALGVEEVRLAKRHYGWPEDETFRVPAGVRAHFQAGIGARGAERRGQWLSVYEAFRLKHPKLADQLDQMTRGEPMDGWDADLPTFAADPHGVATRQASGEVLNAIAARQPWLIGGAADLAPSTKTELRFEGAGDFEAGEFAGRNLHFGIREHAMGAILNGMVLSKLRAFGASFLIFSDYMKPAIRLAAIMGLPVIYVFTHDSIGLGGDGPTHQPIEQLASLRAVPGLVVLRPADANETAESWRVAIGLHDRPVCLALSRQTLPIFDRSRFASAKGVARGAYVMADARTDKVDLILIATGGEVTPCVGAFESLANEGIAVRLVSMPSWELFEQQDQAYRDSVLPPDVVARVSVEAGAVLGWDRYVGPKGVRLGMTRFGASAPAKDLMAMFGFTPEAISRTALSLVLTLSESAPGGAS